jgi:hypothetical protein
MRLTPAQTGPTTPTTSAIALQENDRLAIYGASSSRHHPIQSSFPHSLKYLIKARDAPAVDQTQQTIDCLNVMSLHALLSFCLSEYLTFGLFLLLTALPTKPFLVFAVFYSCRAIVPALIRQPAAAPEATSFASRLTNLFWSSFFVLTLPYGFRGLAFLLHAWSCCIYDLSDRIPVQNAAIAFAIECILLSVPYLEELRVLRLKVKL